MAGGLLSAPVRTDSTAAGRLPGTLHAALSAIGVRQEPVPLHRLSLSATARAVAAGGPGTSPGAEPVGPAATTPGVFRQARTGSSGSFRTDAWNVRLEIALASVALVLWIGVIWRQRKLRRLQAELAERAQVEAALRVSEERYRLISENSNDVIWLFDLTTNRFVFVSPSIERLRGYTVGEVLRQEPTELMTAESYGMVQELLPRRLQAFAAGDDSVRVQTHEIGQTCRDGSVVLTEVVTTLIAGPERRVTHIQGVSRDISGRKTMEQALRRSEQKFATLFRSSPEAFFLTSVPEGRITEVNDSASRLTGYARDALLGSRATDLGLWVNPAQRDHYTAILRQAGRVVDYEGVMRNARGEERICVVSGETVELEEGPHLLTIVHDVTDARRAEEAMRQRMALQDQLARVATTVPGVICSYRLAPDGAASLPFATTALEDVCGLPPEVVREDIAPLLERVHPEDREPLLASIAESARTMQAWGHTFRMEHPQKGERWVEGHSVPRREADGGILWHGFVQDVTERTQAAEALHRERQRLASIIKAADVGTWEWHVQTGETVFNERWAGMLGYTL
ncbi:MAG: PAS domain S-box protein, partial [Verrucomicrobiae bacterium]|nr:PAS domain S-box protein [Verrucomicrobiae bacterium]